MGEVHVAMMNLLWPRSGLPRQWFYDYWSGAHTQISSRLPGIHQYFQHHLDPDLGEGMPGIDMWAESDTEGFFGDAEITFATQEHLADFAAKLNPLMQDEQNVFDKTISYQAPGEFTRSLKDETPDQSPNGNLGDQLKFMIYVQAAVGLSRGAFRDSFVKQVAQPFCESEHISKVRYRLVNFYDNDAVTLLAPNVSNLEASEDQFDGCLEVVFLADSGLYPDVVFTSLLQRAIKTSQITLNACGRLWIPVVRSWRLNERHYGALQGKNKAQTLAEFGEDQFMLWRRSYHTPPPPIDANSEFAQNFDPRYAALPPETVPNTECLADVVERLIPFWEDVIVAEHLRRNETVLVVAHGNSLRALVKHLDVISDEDIAALNIPTGIPLVYKLDKNLKPIVPGGEYLAPEAATAAAASVAAQGKKK